MNQASDIDMLVTQGGLIAPDWATRYPDHSAPTTSLEVILVRKGNPKHIHDWSDLAQPGVSVILANPKLSGNGRYAYLALWGSVLARGGQAAQARAFVAQVLAHVPVLDGGGRAATITYAQRGMGDALLTFESEVDMIQREFGDRFEVVYPSSTILAENPVSVVDRYAQQHGTQALAQAYLAYLWSPQAQAIAVAHHLRPRLSTLLAEHRREFPPVATFSVEQVFGTWSHVLKEHFADGASFDQLMAQTPR